MEKVTTNREVIQITQVNSSESREYSSPEVIRKHESPDKLKNMNGGMVDTNNQLHSNNVNTPLAQNYSVPEHNNMKELKLFSRVERLVF